MKKTYDSKFKSRVALEAMRGELTIAEIASKYQIHPNQVQRWKQRLFEGGVGHLREQFGAQSRTEETVHGGRSDEKDRPS